MLLGKYFYRPVFWSLHQSDVFNTIYMKIFRLLCINYAGTNLSDTEATYDVQQLLTPAKSTGFSSNNFSFVEKRHY